MHLIVVVLVFSIAGLITKSAIRVGTVNIDLFVQDLLLTKVRHLIPRIIKLIETSKFTGDTLKI